MLEKNRNHKTFYQVDEITQIYNLSEGSCETQT